ncbi:MAG: AlpA family phage regulatory protein [Pseudomonadota bacterium]
MQQNTNKIDRIIREAERQHLTSISRSHAWVLEQEGKFPKRIKLGNRSVGWKLSQILAWIEQQGEGDE